MPTATSTALKHGIVNDTSLVAWYAPDNTRHVFFQDIDNSIRQAVFDPITAGWTTDTSDVVATNARPWTPLSLALRTDLTDGIASVFYLSTNDALAYAVFVNDTWQMSYPVISETGSAPTPIAVSSTSRALSVGVPVSDTVVMVFMDQEEQAIALQAVFDVHNSTSLTADLDLSMDLLAAAPVVRPSCRLSPASGAAMTALSSSCSLQRPRSYTPHFPTNPAAPPTSSP